MWQGIKSRKSAIRRLTRFDPSEFRSHTAAEVREFEAKDFLQHKRARRLDRFGQFAVVSALLAVQDAEITLASENRERVGAMMGSALGGVGYAEEQLGRFLRAGAQAVEAAASTNGAASQRPAFYEGIQFTVNMKEMPKQASASTIAHNGSINEIYASNDLDEEQDFISVIDAIQGEGFNPLWRQNLIVFNQGFTPHQFTSEEDVLAAAAGPNPEITIVTTDEVYRCAVVGHK
jgi:Beta-ketoacyl synthase, N-terminal domain